MIFVVSDVVEVLLQLVCLAISREWRRSLCAFACLILLLSPRQDQARGWLICYTAVGGGGKALFLAGFTRSAQYTSNDLNAAETVGC
jgi:hypothetical protein